MKIVPVEEAEGLVLCHDITKIVPGEFKGRAFKKGHVLRREDIPELIKLGKTHIYVWEPQPGEIHEEDAALAIANAVAGANIRVSEPREGKCCFSAATRGLFSVNRNLVDDINGIEEVTLATLPDCVPVEEGQAVAGTRVIPLLIKEEKTARVGELCKSQGPALQVLTYKSLKAALITTGSEVSKGLITDKFGPVIRSKLAHFGAEYLGQNFCPDNLRNICSAILTEHKNGAELIIVTGGMSVDPDDLTPGAIKATGAEVVAYGVPVQPGNMFMLAYLGGTAVIGVPGCAMYHKTTVLDIVLPRLFAGIRIKRADLIRLGVGGFCSGCENCRYPNCYFGAN